MSKLLVLIVDDEQRICNFLSAKFRSEGYETITAQDGREALEQVLSHEPKPDIIILDIMMPMMDGWEFLKELRTFSDIPVIILSAREAGADKIKGLDLGADDYVTKPFNPDELMARARAVLRRCGYNPSLRQALSFPGLEINFSKREAIVQGEEKPLTRIEWLLLAKLAERPGELMSYAELLSNVWGPEYRDDIKLLQTWILRLRGKIEADPKNPQLIRTVPREGYILHVSKPSDL
ncbi:MAG: response regulator transcription factor [Candidatus Nealsonbacteria bacterium]|nr:response regulator transcription factor [Candidatus Nealsonbacteria bacterium]